MNERWEHCMSETLLKIKEEIFCCWSALVSVWTLAHRAPSAGPNFFLIKTLCLRQILTSLPDCVFNFHCKISTTSSELFLKQIGKNEGCGVMIICHRFHWFNVLSSLFGIFLSCFKCCILSLFCWLSVWKLGLDNADLRISKIWNKKVFWTFRLLSYNTVLVEKPL